MKNLLIIIAFVFGIQTAVLSQNKINPDVLISYWQPDQTAGQLFFWKDVNGDLQVQIISGTLGEPFETKGFKVKETFIDIIISMSEPKYSTKNHFTLINDTTLKCEVTGDWTGTLIYSKIK